MEENKTIVDFALDFSYEDEVSSALSDAAGSIEKGKCIVLCGGSGCGKSTLLRCINHLIPQFYEGTVKGFCRINGKSTESLTIGEVGRMAASVFQDPRSHFFTINSSTEVAFGLENHGISREEILRRVDEAFCVFHLEKLKDRNVYELSSGERQLVAILSAWAMDTELLILDEPTANLDFAAISKLHELLLELKQRGKTLLISEHRLHYLNGIADEYWVVSNGKITRRLTAKEMSSLSEMERADLKLRTADLKKLGLKNDRQCEKAIEREFSVENLCCSYKKGEVVLSGVTVSAHTGDVVGIVGSNGSGKTTFGKAAAGLLKPCGGRIMYNGVPMKLKELQREVMFVMQEAEFQFFTNSVENELKYGRKRTGEFDEEIEGLLKKFNMWECRHRHPFSLSGGQMQKLSLMLAYLSSKQVVILDEPTAGLDAESLAECVELIERMRKRKIVFIITHDIEFIAQACTGYVCLSEGKASGVVKLNDKSDLERLIEYMERHFRLSDNVRDKSKISSKRHCDPRTKLLILLAALIAASTSNIQLVIFTALVVIMLAIFEGFYFTSLSGTAIMLLLFGADHLFPGTIISFFAVFFPRLMVTWTGLETIVGKDEATKTLAAFRKMHMPEILITMLSVVFRFFPVLSNDLKLMSQSIKTRGVFSTVWEKLRALPEYIEILLVPMALRVMRIAETLSASAETRGIALKCKRSSYHSLRFGAADAIFAILLLCAVLAGLIVKI